MGRIFTLSVLISTCFIQVTIAQNQSMMVCPGSSIILQNGTENSAWYSDAGMNNLLGTGVSFNTGTLTGSTTIYSVSYCDATQFICDNISANNSNTVDHVSVSGDDRGGIAVTNEYVYVVGDDHTARYNLDLDPNSATQLPLRDGIFSDLSNGNLYTLWSTAANSDPFDFPSSFSFDAIRSLNPDLSLGTTIIPLSQTIDMGQQNAQNGIFAGMGFLVIYSGNTNHYYAISLCNGTVEDLGYLQDPELYGSENWCDWGIAERWNNEYSVVYRNFSNSEIVRRKLPGFSVSTAGSFSDLSDLSCITYSYSKKRWYFHNESTTPVFGGGTETLGYAGASSAFIILSDGLNASTFEITIPEIDLGADTSFCSGTDFVVIADAGYQDYKWNGINSGQNQFTISESTHVILEVTDSLSCILTDTIFIEEINCNGITGTDVRNELSVWPNPASESVNVLPGFDSESDVHYELVDVTGKIIFTGNWQDISITSVKTLDIDRLSAGVYFIHISVGEISMTEKLIVE